MVLTLEIRARADLSFGRGHPSRPGIDHPHVHAPIGWPYLSGLAPEAAPPAPSQPAPVPTPPHIPQRAEPAPRPLFEVAQVEVVQRPAPAPRSPEPARPEVSAALPRLHPLFRKPAKLHSLACREVDGVLVATILSEGLEEEETVCPVRYELRTLIGGDQAAPRRMVIDPGKIRRMSSRAVGVILAHYQAMERQGGTLRACRVSPEIRPVLNSMRLSMVVDLYPTAEEAIADPWE